MEGILKVTPEKLLTASDEFATCANGTKNLTTQMMDLVMGLKGIWQGEAAGAYGARFSGLQNDMDKLYRMIEEHSRDLSEMASSYMQAENSNTEHGNSMRVNVVI